MNSYEIDVLVPLSFLRCACLLLVAHWFTGGHAVAVIALIYIFLHMVFLPSLDATSCSMDAIETHLERLQSLFSRYLVNSHVPCYSSRFYNYPSLAARFVRRHSIMFIVKVSIKHPLNPFGPLGEGSKRFPD